MSRYSLRSDGFTILDGFFDERDLTQVTRLLSSRMTPGEREAGGAYAGFISFTKYDVVSPSDLLGPGVLSRLNGAVANASPIELSLYNSLFVELRSEDAEKKPGFSWHQDVTSFSVLEKGTRAIFCWFILENSMEKGDGTLEFMRRADVRALTGLDLAEQSVYFYETKLFKARHGVDMTSKGRYVILDSLSYKVLGYFDRSPDDLAERPTLRPGDLVVCDKDIMHQTGPTTSKTGRRCALTLRFIEKDARYNGVLDEGVSVFHQSTLDHTPLWQRLRRSGKGARILDHAIQ